MNRTSPTIREILVHSLWVTWIWEWFLELGGRLAEAVLLITTLYFSVKLLPIVHVPPPLDVWMFILQFIALDLGGLSLLKLARLAEAQGNRAGAAQARRLSWALLSIMIAGIMFSASSTLFPLPPALAAGVEESLLLFRMVLAVLYGHTLHSIQADELVIQQPLQQPVQQQEHKPVAVPQPLQQSLQQPLQQSLQQREHKPVAVPPSLQQQEHKPVALPPSLQQQEHKPVALPLSLQQHEHKPVATPPPLQQHEHKPVATPPSLQQHEHKPVATPQPLQQSLQHPPTEKSPPADRSLKHEEHPILSLAREGLRPSEIAQRLGIDRSTVYRRLKQTDLRQTEEAAQTA